MREGRRSVVIVIGAVVVVVVVVVVALAAADAGVYAAFVVAVVVVVRMEKDSGATEVLAAGHDSSIVVQWQSVVQTPQAAIQKFSSATCTLTSLTLKR